MLKISSLFLDFNGVTIFQFHFPVNKVSLNNFFNFWVSESHHHFNSSDYILHAHILPNFHTIDPFTHFYFY